MVRDEHRYGITLASGFVVYKWSVAAAVDVLAEWNKRLAEEAEKSKEMERAARAQKGVSIACTDTCPGCATTAAV